MSALLMGLLCYLGGHLVGVITMSMPKEKSQ
jgi:hypothetical protein